MRLPRKKGPPLVANHEASIQKQILKYLKLVPGCYAWKASSTGIWDAKRNLFRTNASRGVSDIVGVYNGKIFCMEVKSAIGKIRPDQEEFIKNIVKCGGRAQVVRSLSQAIELIEFMKFEAQNVSNA